MNIIIMIVGTRGDVQPFFGLGESLFVLSTVDYQVLLLLVSSIEQVQLQQLRMQHRGSSQHVILQYDSTTATNCGPTTTAAGVCYSTSRLVVGR